MSTTPRPSFADFRDGKEPKKFIFEDDQCVVFDEKINKQAPVHFLVVPKKVIRRLTEASIDDEKLLGPGSMAVLCGIGVAHGVVKGHMLLVAKEVAIKMGLDRTGYHVMVDENHESQNLMSLHVFGRALHHMLWPVGPGSRL